MKRLRKKLYALKEAEQMGIVHGIGKRNSYSKTDHDATFMGMKEDAMGNGQLPYIKSANYEISKTRKYKNDIGEIENMEYDSAADTYICRNGKRLEKECVRHAKSKIGYVSEKKIYKCEENRLSDFLLMEICEKLDKNIRYRMRMCIWKHWKTPQNGAKNLIKLGISRKYAWATAYSGVRIAYVCQRGAMNIAVTKERLTRFGLVSMVDYYVERRSLLLFADLYY